jgi:uncharacterized protein (DUF58 family)
VSVRGPRLLVPSGLAGVILTTLAILALNVRHQPGEARAVLVGTVAVVLTDGWLAFRALRHLDADLVVPATATCGLPFRARTTVVGVRRPATVDPLVAGIDATHFDGADAFDLSCLPTQRGIFDHLLVEVRCRSPLGLWAAARRIALPLQRPLAVGPAPRPDPTLDQPTGAGDPGDGDGDDQDRADDVHPGLVRTTRPYVPGDSARLVHWPATAHEGRLMVRETGGDASIRPAVVIDLSETGDAAEEALGRALTLAADLLARDGAVRLVTVEPEAGPTQPIPRSVLLPATPLRPGTGASGPTQTVDRTETTFDGINRRLAAVACVSIDPGLVPAGALVITDHDHRCAGAEPHVSDHRQDRDAP